MLFQLLTPILGTALVSAQSSQSLQTRLSGVEYTTVTPYYTDVPTAVPVPDDVYWPTRPVQGSYGIDGGGLPLACTTVCVNRIAFYGVCVLNATLPVGPRLLEIPLEACLDGLCDPGAFNHLYQCLNCIVANGGESTRPSAPPDTRTLLAYPSSGGATASPTPTVVEVPATPWPAINADNADTWLSNIREYCEANGRGDVEGERNITATPTTTGITKTSYASGETVDIPNWTQLTTISEVVSSLNADWRQAELNFLTSAPSGRSGPPQASASASPTNSGVVNKVSSGFVGLGLLVFGAAVL